MIVYLARDIPAFVMYCINGESGSSLLIESVTKETRVVVFTRFTVIIIIIIIIIIIVYLFINYVFIHYYNFPLSVFLFLSYDS